MRSLTSIVAVGSNGAIGAGNTLPWRVRSDLNFFRERTLGCVVIMGRKTYESLKRPLPNRRNIVVTHGFSFFPSAHDCKPAGSINEALVLAEKWTLKKKDVFVVGGASMYHQLEPFVDRVLITKIDKVVENADTFFDLSIMSSPNWGVRSIGGGLANGVDDEANYSFYELLRRDISSAVDAREKVLSAWGRGSQRIEAA